LGLWNFSIKCVAMRRVREKEEKIYED